MVASSGCYCVFYLQGDYTNYFKSALLSNLRLSKYACMHQKMSKNVEKCPMWSCKKKKKFKRPRSAFSSVNQSNLICSFIHFKNTTKNKQYQHSATSLPTTAYICISTKSTARPNKLCWPSTAQKTKSVLICPYFNATTSF